jgi:hypothetical protein
MSSATALAMLKGNWVTSYSGLMLFDPRPKPDGQSQSDFESRIRDLPPFIGGYGWVSPIPFDENLPGSYVLREGYFPVAALIRLRLDGTGGLTGVMDLVRGGQRIGGPTRYRRRTFLEGSYTVEQDPDVEGIYQGTIHEVHIGDNRDRLTWDYIFVIRSEDEVEWLWKEGSYRPVVASGTLKRVHYPRHEHLLDRTATTGAKEADGSPRALAMSDPSIEIIAYRGTDDHLHEIWRDAQSEGTTDLTANAAARKAIGDPFPYFDHEGQQVFRGNDSDVRSLHWMTGDAGEDNLTGPIGAPDTTSDPAGWFSPHDGFNHAVYRDRHGHLQELFWKGQGAPGVGDLMPDSDLSAAGSPWPYYDGAHSTNFVAFRGKDAHIRTLFWGLDVELGQDDLSGVAETPIAESDPFAWFTPADDTHRVVYRGFDGHIYELLWRHGTTVTGRDLTELSGAPRAVGNLSGGYNPRDKSHHVVFSSADGKLHELWYISGESTVQYADLTSAYAAPPAVDTPAYWATPTFPTHHVAYRGRENDHIYELSW